MQTDKSQAWKDALTPPIRKDIIAYVEAGKTWSRACSRAGVYYQHLFDCYDAVQEKHKAGGCLPTWTDFIVQVMAARDKSYEESETGVGDKQTHGRRLDRYDREENSMFVKQNLATQPPPDEQDLEELVEQRLRARKELGLE